MAESMDDILVVDADGHVNEGDVDLASRLPEKWRSQAPVRLRDNQGYPRILLEGRVWAASEGPGPGVTGPFTAMEDPRPIKRIRGKGAEMRVTRLLSATLITVALFLPARLWSAEALQKIRIGFPSLAFSYMPFDVAQEKGLLQKAGIEAEYIQMGTGIQPQALINGNIHFLPSLSTGLLAAVSGLPLVVVFELYNGTPWILVAGKEINKPQDFIGKKVAISGLKNSAYFFAQAGLKKLGLGEKDVGYIATGGTASSFAALISNQVAGAVLTPPFDDKAVSLGFKKYLFLGDLVDIPYVGLVTSQAEIKGHRERVQKTIAAIWEGAGWLLSNRGESVKMIAGKFKVTPGEAEHTYETMIGMFNKDGRLNVKVVRGYIDFLRQERPIPADIDPQKFLDFSMLPGGK